jgi:hypothetical protein
MTDQHRATPEQWELLQRQGQTLGSAESIAILELRARIEALEAAQQDKLDRLIALDQEAAMAELRAASAEARPAGGLVERVADVLGHHGDGTARAAIREVATWLEMEGYFAASRAITLELDPT